MEVSSITPEKAPLVLIEEEAGWVPQRVWMFWKIYKSLSSAQRPDYPAHSVSHYSDYDLPAPVSKGKLSNCLSVTTFLIS
jgi:hypothetical protein